METTTLSNGDERKPYLPSILLHYAGENAFLESSNASRARLKKSKMYEKVDKIVGEY